jgi:hypothetical protein
MFAAVMAGRGLLFLLAELFFCRNDLLVIKVKVKRG